MEKHLEEGFVNATVYEMFLLAPRFLDGTDLERLRGWMMAHEIEIMEQIVDPAVEQAVRWFEEGVGA